ncbi:DUF5018 domain-containing protein, partial [Pseudozobellia thermophila]
VSLPPGTDVTALVPTITFTGDSVSPESEVEQDFTDPVIYTVTQGDVSKEYTVTVEVATDTVDPEITLFSINGVEGILSGTDITVSLPSGTDVKSLAPAITYIGESVSPGPEVEQDFTDPVTYTVAQGDVSKEYTVTVEVAADTVDPEITLFSIDGVEGVISETDITVSLPPGTDVKSLAPVITYIGESVSPGSEVEQDFTDPVTYTVTQGDASKEYTVMVEVAAATAKEITGFSIGGVNGSFSGTGITVNLPSGTDVTSLVPAIAYTGESVSPGSGVEQDFTNPVTYTVTAEDGTTRDYIVTVNVAANTPPVAMDDDFTVAENATLNGSVFLDNGNGEDFDADGITVDLVNGSSVNVGATINGSNGGRFTISAGGDLSFDPNGDFDDLTEGQTAQTTVQYRITDGNGGNATAMVTVTVTGIDNGSADNDILQFTLSPTSGDATLDPSGHRVTMTVPFGTDLLVAPTNLVVSPGATVSPLGNVERDFSSPVVYTVTAENGDVQDWTVEITVEAPAPSISFDRSTGRYTAPSGSRVDVTISTDPKSKGVVSLKVYAQGGGQGANFLSLGYNFDEKIPMEDSGYFIMPENGEVYFSGQHEDLFDTYGQSTTNISIEHDTGYTEFINMDDSYQIPSN